MFGVRLCRWAVYVSVHVCSVTLFVNNTLQVAAKVIVLLSYG